MSQSPETLNYQSPRDAGPSPIRKKASRHARGNGVGCLVLSLCFGASFNNPFRFPPGAAPPEITLLLILAMVIVGLYALAYFVCGIIYIIASIKIRQPNPVWERILIISASVHVGVVMLMLIFGLSPAATSGRADASVLIGFVINLAIMISLGQSIQLVVKARREPA